MNVLSVENLTISYRSGGLWREVVHRVSFTIKRGEMLAFVGESGSGKTTTARRLSVCWRKTPASMPGRFVSTVKRLAAGQANGWITCAGPESAWCRRIPATR